MLIEFQDLGIPSLKSVWDALQPSFFMLQISESVKQDFLWLSKRRFQGPSCLDPFMLPLQLKAQRFGTLLAALSPGETHKQAIPCNWDHKGAEGPLEGLERWESNETST